MNQTFTTRAMDANSPGRRLPARQRRHTVLTGVCLLVALVTGSVSTSRAEEPNADQAPRYLGEHLFIPSTVVPDPFVSTTFQTTTGFGSAVNLVVPIYNLHGAKIAETSSNIGYMLLGFDYQYAVKPRLALRVDASGSARIGTSATSILAEGVSALYGYGFGATMSVMRRSNWQLSATADLRGNTLYSISPLGFVRAVVHSAVAGDSAGALAAASDSLIGNGNNLRVLGGLRAAYTPAPWIGFTGFVETGMGEKFQSGSDNTTVTNLGATTSFDLNPLIKVPVGLSGVFRYESLGEKSDAVGSAQDFGLGVFYTGRRFFSVGLESTWSRIGQFRTDEKIDVTQGRIVVRYDFK
jgi:hypothetical protein